MTAGLTNRPMAGTKVALAPTALAALLGGALLAGGIFGAFIASEVGMIGPAQGARQILATSSSPQSQALRRDAQIAVGRGPLAQEAPQILATGSTPASRALVHSAQIAVGRGPLADESGSNGPTVQVAPQVRDHVGVTEGMLPVAATHVVAVEHVDGHGPLR